MTMRHLEDFVRPTAVIGLILMMQVASAPSAKAALVLWEEPAVGIPTLGDAIVRTDGKLVEAINFTPTASPAVRIVNAVPFATRTTAFTGWNIPVFDANIYTGGGVSADFAAILDSFMFGDTPANPGTETLTLGTISSLVVGERYLVQLFVSDDRTATLQARTQDYNGGGSQSGQYTNALSYSLTGTFVADATTQAILFRAFPGAGQTTAAPIINAFQVRAFIPEPSTLLITGIALSTLAMRKRRRGGQARCT